MLRQIYQPSQRKHEALETVCPMHCGFVLHDYSSSGGCSLAVSVRSPRKDCRSLAYVES